MLQYTGFTIVPGGREYSFSVPGHDSASRSFTLVIQNAAFRADLLKYQEGPGICYAKLHAALAVEEADCPVCSRQQITESEAAAYKVAGRAKVRTWTAEQRLKASQRLKANRADVLTR